MAKASSCNACVKTKVHHFFALSEPQYTNGCMEVCRNVEVLADPLHSRAEEDVGAEALIDVTCSVTHGATVLFHEF